LATISPNEGTIQLAKNYQKYYYPRQLKVPSFQNSKKMRAHSGVWLVCAAVMISIVSYTFAGKSTTCPLPADYGLASSNTNSPEKPGPLKAICHHADNAQSFILCLPPNAYNAHLQHGDTPVSFNCTNPGNQGPCSQ
jgi:hypothetical protein